MLLLFGRRFKRKQQSCRRHWVIMRTVVVLLITECFFITSQKLNLTKHDSIKRFSPNKVYFVGLDSSDFLNKNMVICIALWQGRPKRQDCLKSTEIQKTSCLRLMRTLVKKNGDELRKIKGFSLNKMYFTGLNICDLIKRTLKICWSDAVFGRLWFTVNDCVLRRYRVNLFVTQFV